MCDSCNWEGYIHTIEDFLEDNDVRKSTLNYLENVYDWITEHEHITEKQALTINKIANDLYT